MADSRSQVPDVLIFFSFSQVFRLRISRRAKERSPRVQVAAHPTKVSRRVQRSSSLWICAGPERQTRCRPEPQLRGWLNDNLLMESLDPNSFTKPTAFIQLPKELPGDERYRTVHS